MRLSTTVLALTAALGGIASAQPGPPPQPPPPPMDTTTTTTTTETTQPEQTPQPQPSPSAAAPQQRLAEAEEASDRPEGISIGLGVGYGLPTSLETPNRTSARLRLANGVQIEPLVSISNTSTTNDTPTMESESKQTNLGLSALVRFPLMTHNKVDLEGLGTAGFGTNKTNPDGDYNTRTENTFSIGYGVAVAYWLSRHWNFSMSVTNPIVSYTSTKQQTGPNMSTKNGDTTIGLIFVPQVFMMVHLYN